MIFLKLTQKNCIDLINILKNFYPDATCSLNFTSPFELLVAVMLSAQCTDERVNLTTPALFKEYNTPETMAKINLEKLEDFIRPCGFYRNKAKNLKACSQKLISDYNGIVPSDMKELISLPGIGRKSANVIQLEVFGIANGIAVDTHCKRIANRIGLSAKSDPSKIEQDLLNILPQKYLKDVNHLFIWHGRKICTARNPKCFECPIKTFCKTWNNSQEK